MFRFSLRAVFVMTLLAAVGIAVVYHYVRPYRLQADYIERHQGTSTIVSADVGPQWIQGVFGELASVDSLTVFQFDPEDAAAVAAMTDLQFLTLSGMIDDKISTCFNEMTRLVKIDLTDSFVSMRALDHVPNPELVRELRLGVNTCDDDVVELLGEFSGLKKLDLHATQVSDQGLKTVAKCTQLEELSVAGRPITAEGLSHLSSLKNLKSLNLLWCDQLGPQIVDVLNSFPSLTKVALASNYLSEAQRRQIAGVEE